MMAHTVAEASEILDKMTKRNRAWHTRESETTINNSRGASGECSRKGAHKYEDHCLDAKIRLIFVNIKGISRPMPKGLTNTGIKDKEIKVGTTIGTTIMTSLGSEIRTKVFGDIEIPQKDKNRHMYLHELESAANDSSIARLEDMMSRKRLIPPKVGVKKMRGKLYQAETIGRFTFDLHQETRATYGQTQRLNQRKGHLD
ncbi:hypothetical protein HAX54_037012 [Datura stramonium]|uniref:Uncharacterized protein n=1 Tax=Datura stramonium TaxID=4076 RepID=A0ABS8SGX6_DATST|nr:hypothetical protein [Datura stramonium]